jgi:uncharacterized protein (TIGR02145 family)
MKTKIYFTFIFVSTAMLIYSQRYSMELTFTAVNSADRVQLDSIKVMNRTQGGDTTLYWPDTVLVLDYPAGITDLNSDIEGFQVFQNYPNPVAEQTTISMYVPEKDRVRIIVSDIIGRSILKEDRVLHRGRHAFRFIPGNANMYFFTAQWRGHRSNIKILHLSTRNNAGSLEYMGSIPEPSLLKAEKALREFSYNPGDELLYIGYAGTLQSGMLDNPDTSQTYTFQFATNIPCPGTPTVEYQGQVYNTIQIFSQCWLKENLNVGWQIPGSGHMSDNGFIEKYCYNDEPDSCTKYGGLYQWDEMMQYTTQQGAQGICPSGWHLPTDEEWKVLEGAVDSQYGIGHAEWDKYEISLPEWRGFDAGTNLKKNDSWKGNGNGTDLYGFAALPGGFLQANISYRFIGIQGFWWMSTESSSTSAWSRYLGSNQHGVFRDINDGKNDAVSARCIRDSEPTIELIFTAVNNTTHVQVDSIKVMNQTQGGERMLFGSDTTLLIPRELLFNPGDEMIYIGYSDTLQSAILDTPAESQMYTFQFATNIPCPGMPTVDYEGQVYNTIQVMSQCWLKENLDAGTMIQGNQFPQDNGLIEKYCYNNSQINCNSYGALYSWNEMMAYTTEPGSRGICPQGWHVPSTEEWRVLFGVVDSQYGIGAAEWDLPPDEFIGYDVGKNLKSTSGWSGNGSGTDLFGFSVLPGGYRHTSGSFNGLGEAGNLLTSNQINASDAAHLFVSYDHSEVGLSDFMPKTYAISLRCLKDD